MRSEKPWLTDPFREAPQVRRSPGLPPQGNYA